MENKSWNDWIFQIHWNKLQWVNPRIHFEVKNKFCVSKTLFLKDINKSAHWVGYPK